MGQGRCGGGGRPQKNLVGVGQGLSHTYTPPRPRRHARGQRKTNWSHQQGTLSSAGNSDGPSLLPSQSHSKLPAVGVGAGGGRMEQLQKKTKSNFSSHGWPGPRHSHRSSAELARDSLSPLVGPHRGASGEAGTPLAVSEGPCLPSAERLAAPGIPTVTRPGSSTMS